MQNGGFEVKSQCNFYITPRLMDMLVGPTAPFMNLVPGIFEAWYGTVYLYSKIGISAVAEAFFKKVS